MSFQVSDFYDDFADYQLRYLVFPNRRHRAIQECLRPFVSQRKSALDIGCGIGVMTDWLAHSLDRVVGIDISPRNIRIAAALYSTPEFALCALPDDSLPQGPFDLVTLLDVLEHFPPSAREKVFGRIAEVIADDAVVAVNVPSKLYALQVPNEVQQVIDEAIGSEEVVALAAGIGMETLVLERYGVDVQNQYMFCAFSRTYPTMGTLRRGLRVQIEDRIGYLRNRHRYGKQLDRLRRL